MFKLCFQNSLCSVLTSLKWHVEHTLFVNGVFICLFSNFMIIFVVHLSFGNILSIPVFSHLEKTFISFGHLELVDKYIIIYCKHKFSHIFSKFPFHVCNEFMTYLLVIKWWNAVALYFSALAHCHFKLFSWSILRIQCTSIGLLITSFVSCVLACNCSTSGTLFNLILSQLIYTR